VASRVAWSARQASQDAGEGLNKAAESLSSLTSMDEDQYYQNPTDPTRVSQHGKGGGGGGKVEQWFCGRRMREGMGVCVMWSAGW
jgi:hypothetical protein